MAKFPGKERFYLAANILDVAGPRLQVKPLAGMPSIEVLEPELDGANRFIKRTVDLLLSVLAPVISLPIVALIINFEDGGRIFFLQTRVGQNNVPFQVIKFRTMADDANKQLDTLAQTPELNRDNLRPAGNRVLFEL